MDKSALLAMLVQQAPMLLQMINAKGGLGQVPNIAEALDSGMDAGLMEARALPLSKRFADHPGLDGLDVLEGLYTGEEVGTAFPSDGSSPESMANLFAHLKQNERQAIGGNPAELSAATFLANGSNNIPSSGAGYADAGLGNDTYASHLGNLLHDTDGSADEDARASYLEWLRRKGYK